MSTPMLRIRGFVSSLVADRGRAARFAVTAAFLVAAGCYFSFRDPAWRAVDFARVTHYWRLFWGVVATTPERVGPLLSRFGIIQPQPVPLRLSWGVVMLLDPFDFVDSRLLFAGSWEAEEWRWVQDHLRAGETFVDVGAHHGTYTLRAAAVAGATGRVIAIEPNPDALVRLRKNISLNSFASISVLEFACGDKSSTMRLYSGSRQNTGMTSLSWRNARVSGDDGGPKCTK